MQTSRIFLLSLDCFLRSLCLKILVSCGKCTCLEAQLLLPSIISISRNYKQCKNKQTNKQTNLMTTQKRKKGPKNPIYKVLVFYPTATNTHWVYVVWTCNLQAHWQSPITESTPSIDNHRNKNFDEKHRPYHTSSSMDTRTLNPEDCHQAHNNYAAKHTLKKIKKETNKQCFQVRL